MLLENRLAAGQGRNPTGKLCYRLAIEDIKPLCRYRSPKDTVKGIMKFNPNAKELIEKLLA